MNFKRLLALLMAFVMLFCLAACGNEEKGPDADKKHENSTEELYTESGYLINSLNIGGEDINTDGLVMMTIDGVEIPFDEYRYMYTYVDNVMFSGGDETYWEGNEGYFSLLLMYAENEIIENNWSVIMANKYGVELTDEDLADIDSYLEEQKTYFDSIEEYEEALRHDGINEDLLRRIITKGFLGNRVYEDLYNKEGAPLAPSDDEIKAELAENYVRVYHVLITPDSYAAGDEITEDDWASAKEYAEDVLARVLDGEDIYQIAQDEGEDPGMMDNIDGYFFTYGEMVEPFETASFALGVGEISGVVETSYGYHIIQRLEQEEYVKEHWDEVRADFINAAFNKDIDELIANAEITHWDSYDDLTYTSIH